MTDLTVAERDKFLDWLEANGQQDNPATVALLAERDRVNAINDYHRAVGIGLANIGGVRGYGHVALGAAAVAAVEQAAGKRPGAELPHISDDDYRAIANAVLRNIHLHLHGEVSLDATERRHLGQNVIGYLTSSAPAARAARARLAYTKGTRA